MSLSAIRDANNAPVVVDERDVCKDIGRIVRRECPKSCVREGGTIMNVGNDTMSISYLCDCPGREFVACVEYSLIPEGNLQAYRAGVDSLSVRQGDKLCFGRSGYRKFECYAKRLGLDVEFSGADE